MDLDTSTSLGAVSLCCHRGSGIKECTVGFLWYQTIRLTYLPTLNKYLPCNKYGEDALIEKKIHKFQIIWVHLYENLRWKKELRISPLLTLLLLQHSGRYKDTFPSIKSRTGWPFLDKSPRYPVSTLLLSRSHKTSTGARATEGPELRGQYPTSCHGCWLDSNQETPQ